MGKLVVFLELHQEVWGSSRFLKVNLGNLVCCLMKVNPLLELQDGAWDCSRVTAREMGFASRGVSRAISLVAV